MQKTISNLFAASFLFLILLFALSLGFARVTARADATSQIAPVTVSDLNDAGYADVTAQGPEGNEYQPPVFYFWVNNANEFSTMTGSTFDLAMVSEYNDGTPYTDALFSYGTSTNVSIDGASAAQEAPVGYGRSAVNFAKGDYYVVVIAPDAQKALSLARIVADKL